MIVGGAVPWLLLPDARPQHIGTLDIDLDLNVEELSEGEYSTMIELLEKAGLSTRSGRYEKSFSCAALLRLTKETQSLSS